MKNDRVINSWNAVEPDEDAQERMLRHILECVRRIPKERQGTPGNGRKLPKRLFPPLAAGLTILLLSGSTIAYAALSSSGRLNFFRGNPNSDKNTDVVFEITDDIRIGAEEITGRVNECSQIIQKQCAEYNPLSSQLPTACYRDFSSPGEAEEYIGYANLRLPALKRQPEMARVHVLGNADGRLTEIVLEADYTTDSSITFQSEALLFTEHFQGDIRTGLTSYSDAFEGVDYSGGTQQVNGREFYVINSSPFKNGWLTRDVFWQEKSVVYMLYIRYQAADQKDVDRIALEWMKKF